MGHCFTTHLRRIAWEWGNIYSYELLEVQSWWDGLRKCVGTELKFMCTLVQTWSLGNQFLAEKRYLWCTLLEVHESVDFGASKSLPSHSFPLLVRSSPLKLPETWKWTNLNPKAFMAASSTQLLYILHLLSQHHAASSSLHVWVTASGATTL